METGLVANTAKKAALTQGVEKWEMEERREAPLQMYRSQQKTNNILGRTSTKLKKTTTTDNPTLAMSKQSGIKITFYNGNGFKEKQTC